MAEQAVLDLESIDSRYVRNPYPLYAMMRDRMPVRQIELHGLRGWLVTRYEDVRHVLSDRTLSHDRSRANAEARSAAWLFADEAFDLQHHMLRSDPPAHGRMRRLVAPAFAPARIGQLRGRITKVANELIDGFDDREDVDLISEFAFPLPLQIIIELLGLPANDHDMLQRWSNVLSSGQAAGEEEISTTLRRMRDYFDDLAVRWRDDDSGDGLFGVLVDAWRRSLISQAELLSSAFQLLQGGHVTTLGLIANATLALLCRPLLLKAAHDDVDVLDGAVDEFMRFDPPMEVATIRFTTTELQIGPTTIPGGGEPVILALASANRDRGRYRRPDVVDVRRDASDHLAFGWGPHHCIGAHLGRLETRVALRQLVGRLESLELAVNPSQLAWRPNPHLRRPEQLPIRFTSVLDRDTRGSAGAAR